MARQSRAPSALLTRPEAQSRRLAAQMAERFGAAVGPVVVSPLMAPRFLTPVLPAAPARALILTSETGAEAAGRLARDGIALPKRAFCVGDRTATAAAMAGFQAISAAGDADALVALILAGGDGGPLLHLHGADTRGDVAGRLTAAGITATSAIVYRQEPRALTGPARDLLAGRQPVIVPLFSPRSAALFVDAAGSATAPLWIVAISPATAETARSCRPVRIGIARRPDGDSMLAAIGALLRDDPAT